MSTQIIAALRYETQLRGNTFLIATELAHRMNGQGQGRVSYTFLARAAHCSPRTAIRQIARLCTLGLIRKTVTYTPKGCDWNQYQYLGARVHTAFPSRKTRYDRSSRNLPKPEEREKELSLKEELENYRKVLRLGYYTPGSERWTQTQEDIGRLEALLEGVCHA